MALPVTAADFTCVAILPNDVNALLVVSTVVLMLVAVVEKAHSRPRFVEDCVREMVAGVVERFPELDGASFVSARQENLETIHQHNVVAERHGLLAELREEMSSGIPAPRHTSLEQWLEPGRPQPSA